MLTRRGFLVAGGIGVGALAVGGYVANDLAADRGIDLLAEAKQRIGLGPTVREASFTSAHLRQEVNWLTVTPRDTALAGLPLVLALHGRGGTAWDAVGWLRADTALQEHVERGGAPFAIVSVDGGDHSYYHPRADGTDALRMLTDELLPRVADLGVRTARLGVMGWSMGGFGALMLARESAQGRLPGHEVVAAIGTAPALWAEPGASAPGAFDDAEDFDRWGDLVTSPGIDGTVALRVDCGDEDPFAGAVRAYRRKVEPTPAGGFVPGGHDGACWRPLLPAQLAFLAEHLTAPV